MKKIFTLVLTLFILNAAFSQTYVSRVSVQTPNFGVNYDRNYGDNYSGYNNDRGYGIEKINAIYEQQMHEVMCLPVSTGKKIALIRRLQREKARKMNHINRDHYNYNSYNNQQFDNSYNNQHYNNNKW